MYGTGSRSHAHIHTHTHTHTHNIIITRRLLSVEISLYEII